MSHSVYSKLINSLFDSRFHIIVGFWYIYVFIIIGIILFITLHSFGFTLNKNISINDIITALSLLGSALVVVGGWYYNEIQKRNENAKKFADELKSSASAFLASLEWRKNVNISFFLVDIDPIIEEADNKFIDEEDLQSVASFFWQNVSESRGEVSKKIAEQQIEFSCKELYGYSPLISYLIKIIDDFDYIDRLIYINFLNITWDNITTTNKYSDRGGYIREKNRLGKRLRQSASLMRFEYVDIIDDVIKQFRQILLKLANENELDIYNNNIKFPLSIDQSHILALRGLEHRHLRRYDESCIFYEKAIKLNKNKSGYWAGLALSYLSLETFENKAEEAIEISRKLQIRYVFSSSVNPFNLATSI